MFELIGGIMKIRIAKNRSIKSFKNDKFDPEKHELSVTSLENWVELTKSKSTGDLISSYETTDEAKKHILAAFFSSMHKYRGKYKQRKDFGLYVFDLDEGIEGLRDNKVKEYLRKRDGLIFFAKSTSGNGWYGLAKAAPVEMDEIPTDYQKKVDFYTAWTAVVKEVTGKYFRYVSQSQKHFDRIRYISYDPSPIYKPETYSNVDITFCEGYNPNTSNNLLSNDQALKLFKRIQSSKLKKGTCVRCQSYKKSEWYKNRSNDKEASGVPWLGRTEGQHRSWAVYCIGKGAIEEGSSPELILEEMKEDYEHIYESSPGEQWDAHFYLLEDFVKKSPYEVAPPLTTCSNCKEYINKNPDTKVFDPSKAVLTMSDCAYVTYSEVLTHFADVIHSNLKDKIVYDEDYDMFYVADSKKWKVLKNQNSLEMLIKEQHEKQTDNLRANEQDQDTSEIINIFCNSRNLTTSRELKNSLKLKCRGEFKHNDTLICTKSGVIDLAKNFEVDIFDPGVHRTLSYIDITIDSIEDELISKFENDVFREILENYEDIKHWLASFFGSVLIRQRAKGFTVFMGPKNAGKSTLILGLETIFGKTLSQSITDDFFSSSERNVQMSKALSNKSYWLLFDEAPTKSHTKAILKVCDPDLNQSARFLNSNALIEDKLDAHLIFTTEEEQLKTFSFKNPTPGLEERLNVIMCKEPDPNDDSIFKVRKQFQNIESDLIKGFFMWLLWAGNYAYEEGIHEKPDSIRTANMRMLSGMDMTGVIDCIHHHLKHICGKTYNEIKSFFNARYVEASLGDNRKFLNQYEQLSKMKKKQLDGELMKVGVEYKVYSYGKVKKKRYDIENPVLAKINTLEEFEKISNRSSKNVMSHATEIDEYEDEAEREIHHRLFGN